MAAAALVSTRSTAVTGWARRLGAGDARRALVSDAAITTALTLLGAVAVADGSFDATVGPEIPAAPAPCRGSSRPSSRFPCCGAGRTPSGRCGR